MRRLNSNSKIYRKNLKNKLRGGGALSPFINAVEVVLCQAGPLKGYTSEPQGVKNACCSIHKQGKIAEQILHEVR